MGEDDKNEDGGWVRMMRMITEDGDEADDYGGW